MKVDIFPSQAELLKANEKYILFLASRGYGKSYSVAWWLITKLLSGCYRCILTNATFQQLRETTKYLLQHLDSISLPYAINCKPGWCQSLLSDHKNILSVDIGDGQHHYIKLLSFDNIESIRGSSCDALAIDEGALAREEYFDTAILTLRGHPNGMNHNYQCLIATTPTTVNNWIWKRFIETIVPSFKQIKAFAEENFIEYDNEKLSLIKSTMTDMMWRREMLCEWISLSSNTVFYAFSKEHIKQLQVTDKRLFISCDMNVDGLTSIIGYFDTESIFIEDEIVIKENGNAIKMAAEFHKKYSSKPNKSLYLTGDRSTKNRSAASTTTYHQQLINELKRLGWQVTDKTLQSNPSQFDSAEMVNRQLELNKLCISPNCKTLIDDCSKGIWKDTTSDKFEIDKAVCRFDAGDCLRYIIWSVNKPRNIVAMNF